MVFFLCMKICVVLSSCDAHVNSYVLVRKPISTKILASVQRPSIPKTRSNLRFHHFQILPRHHHCYFAQLQLEQQLGQQPRPQHRPPQDEI